MDSKLTLIIDPEAIIEIDKAIAYYENSQPGLGREFYYYLEGYFKTLQQGDIFFN